jgi:hypothetical protein
LAEIPSRHIAEFVSRFSFINRVAAIMSNATQVLVVNETLSPRDFLWAADFKTLALLGDADVAGGVQKRTMGSGIEPSVNAANDLDGDPPARIKPIRTLKSSS